MNDVVSVLTLLIFMIQTCFYKCDDSKLIVNKTYIILF